MKTKEYLKLQVKATALNEIRKLYNPKTPIKKTNGYYWDDIDRESFKEQRDSEVRDIVKKLEEDLIDIKHNKYTKDDKRRLLIIEKNKNNSENPS